MWYCKKVVTVKDISENQLKEWRQSLYEAAYNAKRHSPMSYYGMRRLVFVLEEINKTIDDGENVEV